MLEAALRQPAAVTAPPYRRATGAARRAAGSSVALDAIERPSADTVRPVPVSQIREMVSPIVSLIAEMPFYSMMGASTQVVVVDIDSTLSVAFIAATESRVSSVLLWDSTRSSFVGVLTVTDYIRILLHCNDENEDSSELAAVSIRSLLSAEWLKRRKGDFVWGTPNLTVLEALKAMRDYGINRLPILASKVFEEEQANLTREPVGVQPQPVSNASLSGSIPAAPKAPPIQPPPSNYSVVSVITLTQLLAHLGRVLLSMGPLGADEQGAGTLFDVPLASLHVGANTFAVRDGVVPSITRSSSVADALRIMLSRSVNAVCVLDENSGRIVDVITRTDVLRMESGGSYDITLPLSEALSWRPPQRAAVVCCPNDTFGDVLAHFVGTWVKEMFVVDPQTEAVLGQVSMKELLYFLIDSAGSP